MNNTTGQTPCIANTASGAADLLTLIEAYAEARHHQGHSSYNAQTATARRAVKAALAAGQATVAQQGVAYAALPTSSHAGSFLIGTCPLYTADKMRAFADAALTAQAISAEPAGATEPTEQQILESAFAPAQPAVGVPLLDYAMQIAHERELRVTGSHHDEDGAKLRFEAAAMRHTATGAAQPDSVQEDAACEAIEKVLALFPFNALIQKFTVNNGPCLTADNDDEFYSVKRVLAFLTEIKTTLDAARKQGEKQ